MRLFPVLAVAIAMPAMAQFGGLVNKAKSKIDQTNQKAKPVTDRGQKAVDSFSVWPAEDEQAIGEAAAAKLVAAFGLVDNPAVTRYVNLVGHSVAQFAPRELPYRFGVLDTDMIGAFAVPGGIVFVTRAALESMTNEAQLAGVLGHEVIHAAERHLETEIRSKNASSWATMEAKQAAASTQAGRTVNQLRADSLLNDLFTMRLSRSKEDAADRHGAELAIKAGYAANGLEEFLAILAAANTDPANKRAFGQLLSTHPAFDDRIKHLQAMPGVPAGVTLEDRFRKSISQ